MKYGIISDIHGNIQALNVALETMEQEGVDHILCLGDLVGYGANPAEVVAAVRDRVDFISICGNHDRQVNGRRDPRMRKVAAEALDWTRDNLPPRDIEWLEELAHGLLMEKVGVMLIHGSLLERDSYILNGLEIRRNLEVMVQEYSDHRICLFGHTHVPLVVSPRFVTTDLKQTRRYPLDPDDVYLINPGSVGQPRDRCPLSCFAILDTDPWSITFHRREYDIAAAQEAIRAAGLPDRFAERLETGS
jgi:predicted phosphodiesterase